jgi:hypothetical protein
VPTLQRTRLHQKCPTPCALMPHGARVWVTSRFVVGAPTGRHATTLPAGRVSPNGPFRFVEEIARTDAG